MKKIFTIIIGLIITILPIKVSASSINLNKTEILLGVDYTETLTVNLSEDLNHSNVEWHSSDEKIAKVTNGTVRGISEGKTYVTASINGNQATCLIIVSSEYIAVSGITLNKTTLNLSIGASETLIKTITPSTATNKDVKWHSSDPNIAEVDQLGKVTAKKVGTTTITAYTEKKSVTCKVNVVNVIELKGIELDKNTLKIKENETTTLTVKYNPSNATNKNIIWESSNKRVATVDQTGKITGLSTGTTTIIVKTKDGKYVTNCKVTVEAISKKVTNVSLDKKELKINAGEVFTLKATISPNYAENKNITWESSDETIATVNQTGKVTAKKTGKVEIKVITEDERKEAICKITVLSPPIKNIKFKEEEMTVFVNRETNLQTITDPVNAVLDDAIWTSSNENVATIEAGVLKTLSIGETTITVSNKEKTISASINIKVIQQPKEKINIKIEGYDLKFNPNKKNYTLEIESETSLNIITNIDKDKVRINGNQNLKDGSIITININDDEKITYVINIKKKENYTIYFIAIISLLLLINLIKIMRKNKKKK